MPLDVLTPTVRTETLADLLAQHDIRPVEEATLTAHKLAQQRRFGPSFWYRHQGALGVALIGSVGFMALTAGAVHSLMPASSSVAMWISNGWIALMAALIVSGVVRARAGSHWEERWLPADRLERAGVPEPIAATARDLHAKAPGATLVLGELKMDTVVLDPYLLLVRGEERVCLGVWDDDGIIAIAR
jgi:hypothetical protein